MTAFTEEISTPRIYERGDPNNNPTQHKDQTGAQGVSRTELIWILTLLGVVIVVCAQLCVLLYIKRKRAIGKKIMITYISILFILLYLSMLPFKNGNKMNCIFLF